MQVAVGTEGQSKLEYLALLGGGQVVIPQEVPHDHTSCSMAGCEEGWAAR